MEPQGKIPTLRMECRPHGSLLQRDVPYCRRGLGFMPGPTNILPCRSDGSSEPHSTASLAFPRAGFLSGSTIDILDQIILHRGGKAVLYIVGRLAATPAFTH